MPDNSPRKRDRAEASLSSENSCVIVRWADSTLRTSRLRAEPSLSSENSPRLSESLPDYLADGLFDQQCASTMPVRVQAM